MKRLILLVGLLMLLTLDVYATELPDDLKDALPESAEELMKVRKIWIFPMRMDSQRALP